MNSLFSHEGPIRTLGFYEPFGSLMLHGKIETRWIMTGKKPPFPLGRYAFYTTQKECTCDELLEWCGEDLMEEIMKKTDHTVRPSMLLGFGTLTNIRPMTIQDEPTAFVKYHGLKTVDTPKGMVRKTQWALIFTDVKAIEPVWFLDDNGKSLGKQGVGFLPAKFKHLV